MPSAPNFPRWRPKSPGLTAVRWSLGKSPRFRKEGQRSRWVPHIIGERPFFRSNETPPFGRRNSAGRYPCSRRDRRPVPEGVRCRANGIMRRPEVLPKTVARLSLYFFESAFKASQASPRPASQAFLNSDAARFASLRVPFPSWQSFPRAKHPSALPPSQAFW